MTKQVILIVEDNKLEAKATGSFLENSGFETIWAKSGMEGLKCARVQRPDLILMDVVLPDKDGREICRFLKGDAATLGIPIIMLTARSGVEDKVKGLRIGADDYLPKPFDEKELLARINACLRTKALQDELRSKNEQLEGLLRQVEIMAITDAGTGLFNRRHFLELMDKEFERAKRFNSPLACLMMDIDHFKQINDTYGHLIGDSVLLELGKILQNNMRNIEVAARYGGEEFVLLLPETSPAEAYKPSQRLLEQIRSYRFSGLDPNYSMTVSIGIAGLPDTRIQTKEELIQCADFSLYKAKRRGRNRIETGNGAECLSNPSSVA